MAEFSFEDRYSNIAFWVTSHAGWIEVGQTEMSDSFVRAMDIGGMIWEGEPPSALEAALAAHIEERGL